MLFAAPRDHENRTPWETLGLADSNRFCLPGEGEFARSTGFWLSTPLWTSVISRSVGLKGTRASGCRGGTEGLLQLGWLKPTTNVIVARGLYIVYRAGHYRASGAEWLEVV